MIIRALADYYDRMAQDPTSGIAPIGWQDQPIGWVVRLAADGSVLGLESTYEQAGKRRAARTIRVPEGSHTNAITPRLLWDNPEYVLGVAKEGSKKPEDAAKKQASFVQRIKNLGLESLQPVVLFLENNPAGTLSQCPGYGAFQEDVSALITFRLGNDLCTVCEREDFKAAYERQRLASLATDGRCIITGNPCRVTQTAQAIRLRNATSSGCKLIAFQKGCGFDSYGKEQGANAPIGEEVTFKYTTALKTLLASADNGYALGDDTVIFWSSRPSPVDDAMALFCNPKKDDPNAGAEAVKAIYGAVAQGLDVHSLSEGRFYILGLQPNAARIAVRFWVEQSLDEAARHLHRYFEDLSLVGRSENEPIPLYLLLRALSPREDTKNLPPQIAGDLFRAAVSGTPFPDSMAQAVLRRLKSEPVTPVRAALLKGWLNRRNFNHERRITPMLDMENTNAGYLLGRLFATLEKAQAEALGKVSASVKDRYYATASSAPIAVFATLLRTNMFHMRKLSDGRRIWFENLKGCILEKLGDIPAHLNLTGQAHFALGYYHQMRELFPKKTDKENEHD